MIVTLNHNLEGYCLALNLYAKSDVNDNNEFPPTIDEHNSNQMNKTSLILKQKEITKQTNLNNRQ